MDFADLASTPLQSSGLPTPRPLWLWLRRVVIFRSKCFLVLPVLGGFWTLRLSRKDWPKRPCGCVKGAPLSTVPIDSPSGGLFRCALSVEFGQDRLNSSNGFVAIFHPRRRHESLVQLQICPDAHQPKIVCNVEPDHLDEIFERLFAFVIENDSHRQRLVELQALAGLRETANIYPLRLFQ